MESIRIVCLSDTHGRHDELDVPEGDILLHAGDFSERGRPAEVEDFGRFLARLPHPEKVVIAGNHDFLFERDGVRARQLLGPVTYLQDSAAAVAGLRVWGSPWQPWHHDWAFNLERGAALAAKWRLIPDEIDILLTHSPPYGILDEVVGGENVGCEELRNALDRRRPPLHVFGHIHEQRGSLIDGDTLLVNACNCDLTYRPVHAPIVIDWTADGPKLVSEP